MPKGRDIKGRARHAMRNHYWLFVLLCVLLGFAGIEYNNTFSAITAEVQVIQSAADTLGHEMLSEMLSESSAETETSDQTYISDNDGLADVFSEEVTAIQKQLQSIASQSNSDAMSVVLGRTNGYLAQIVNGASSGSFAVSFQKMIRSLVSSKSAADLLITLLKLVLSFVVFIWIKNVLKVISRRFFLEGRTYEKSTAQRAFFLLKVKKWARTAWVMFVKSIYLALWYLTIVGGIIKSFSYAMVPYILAENPDMSAKEAITLSRKMMDGHKMQYFLIQLSFIGWYLLGALSFQMVNIFFTFPYLSATGAEFYAALREQAIEKKIETAEKLNDKWLFEVPPTELLEETYADVSETFSKENPMPDPYTGVRGFLARWFGIVMIYNKRTEAQEAYKVDKMNKGIDRDALRGQVYPSRLYPIPESKRRMWVNTLNYTRYYSLSSIIILFLSFNVIGWIWEVSLHLSKDGFVNRGFLHGPWIPIYGTGGIIILLALFRLRRKPVREFFIAILLCGVVEYFTSFFMELANNGQRWWNYTGYFLNLNGRICAEGLLIFGIMGMVIVYVVAPLMDFGIRKLPGKLVVLISVIWILIFCVDVGYSVKHPNEGKGITTEQVQDSK